MNINSEETNDIVICEGVTQIDIGYIEGTDLDCLVTLTRNLYIDELSKASTTIFDEATIATVDELAAVVGKCIINEVFIKAITAQVEKMQQDGLLSAEE